MARFHAIAFLVLLSSSASAFSTAPSPPATATRMNLMASEEVDALIGKATDCSEGECSLDEVSDLISVLKEQQSGLYKRVNEVKTMIKSLEAGNTADDREVDEIRETVRALFRVFQLGSKASGNDYPLLTKPTGWSGEVGSGPTDAYKSLDPKPYKKK